MAVTLPPLPYDKKALEPHISAETFDFHHGKHHAAYVNKLNELVKGTKFEGATDADLEKIVAESDGAIFNNAAQVWNHTFYWHCMAPNAGGAPSDAGLVGKIDADLGGFEKFKKDFAEAAATQFGSGWAWLVFNAQTGKLEIVKTANADTPIRHAHLTPLLTVDVWEHAYYVDYRNKRPDYVEVFITKLVNWKFVAENLAKATKNSKAA